MTPAEYALHLSNDSSIAFSKNILNHLRYDISKEQKVLDKGEFSVPFVEEDTKIRLEMYLTIERQILDQYHRS